MNQTLRKMNVVLTGLFFAAYSANYVSVLFKSDPSASLVRIVSTLVVLAFAVLALYVWTSVADKKNARFMMIRRIAFIVAMITVIILRLRTIGQVISFLDFSKLYTILNTAAYFVSTAGLLIIFVYYAFIRSRVQLNSRARFALGATAVALFLCGLILEAILFFAYGIGVEPGAMRTLVFRPAFYLGLIGLCLYFRFPPQSVRKASKAPAEDPAKE